MNDNSGDVHRPRESHIFPRLARIIRLINAVAPRRALTVVGFAGASPDDGWARGRDRNVTNARDSFFIENVCPRRSAVGRLENAAGGCRDIDRSTIVWRNLNIVYTAAHRCRADLTKLQTRH